MFLALESSLFNFFEARMKLTISFKHLKHSDALDTKIKEKTEKLEKYFQGNTSVHWVCWVHENEHWAEIKVHGPKFDFFAKASSDNMYKTLDLCIEKMERQVERQKDIKRNKLHHAPYETPKYKEIAARVHEEEEYLRKEIDERTA
jgi:putative sigma-54 modulation protein